MHFKKILLTFTLLFQLTALYAGNSEDSGVLHAITKDDPRALVGLLDKFYKKNKTVDQSASNSELLIASLLLQKPNVIGLLLNQPININSSVTIDSCTQKNGWQTKYAYEIFCAASTNLSRTFTDMTLTPLQATCLTGDLATMKMLIKAGATVDGRTEELSPLESCLATKNFNQVVFLIDHGANVRAKNYSISPMMTLSSISADESNQDVAKLLAEKMIFKGADPHYIAKTRYSELHAAAGAGNLVIVKLLVQLGVDINGKADSGLTPLGRAEKNKHAAVVDFLISKGAQK